MFGIAYIGIASIFLGFTVSAIVNYLKIHPVVATLAAGYIYYSLSLELLNGPNLFLGNKLNGLSEMSVVGAALIIFTFYVAVLVLGKKTNLGQRIIATGSNPELAQRHGISVFIHHAIGLSLSFLCVMTSGALFALKSQSVDISHGAGLLLLAIGVVLVTRAISKRLSPIKNGVFLFLCVISYLLILQGVLYLGLPPNCCEV